MSQLFAERAPAERELLHCMVGGVRQPGLLELGDAELAARTVGELDRVLGVRAEPEVLRVARWPRAVAALLRYGDLHVGSPLLQQTRY